MNWLSTIGLLVNIIGVIIVFKKGLPREVSADTSNAVGVEGPEYEKNSWENRIDEARTCAKVGLGAIIVGLILQLLGNVVPFL